MNFEQESLNFTLSYLEMETDLYLKAVKFQGDFTLLIVSATERLFYAVHEGKKFVSK